MPGIRCAAGAASAATHPTDDKGGDQEERPAQELQRGRAEEMRGQSHAGEQGACSGNACPKSHGTGKQAIRAGASMRRTCIGTLLLKKSEV